MVFTLQRYIFRELFKVFILATIGLTLILSLGGILQPVQEYGVGPRQVLHILLYFMPITLTFVLPMSALFASALTYGRFASDNELDACRASGVSLMTMAYPGLILALFVATANLVLSFHVMPLFVHLAEKSLKADAKQILIRNIQRRGFYKVPGKAGFMIYADYAEGDELMGIIVVKTDRGVVEKIYTADRASIDFRLGDRVNEVNLDVRGLRQTSHGTDWWVEVGDAKSLGFEFGSLLGDDIKFKRVGEMKRIRANLMLFQPIAEMARVAQAQLAAELLVESINAEMHAPGTPYYELHSATRTVRFSVASCELQGQRAISLDPNSLIVHEFDRASERFLHTLRCERGSDAGLRINNGPDGATISLILHNARFDATDRLTVYHPVSGLALPAAVRQKLDGQDILKAAVVGEMPAVLDTEPSQALLSIQKNLRKEIRSTMVDIVAEMNSRLVFGIGCVPMIMIGIGLGIINRGSHLLSAFGASCLPAAVLIVTIISGKHVTENTTAQGISGIAVMWGGLAFLTLLALLLYAKLSKN